MLLIPGQIDRRTRGAAEPRTARRSCTGGHGACPCGPGAAGSPPCPVINFRSTKSPQVENKMLFFLKNFFEQQELMSSENLCPQAKNFLSET